MSLVQGEEDDEDLATTNEHDTFYLFTVAIAEASCPSCSLSAVDGGSVRAFVPSDMAAAKSAGARELCDTWWSLRDHHTSGCGLMSGHGGTYKPVAVV